MSTLTSSPAVTKQLHTARAPGLFAYFVIAFGLAWLCLGLAILAGYGFIPIPFVVFVTAGTLAPLVAASGVTAYESGSAGVRALLGQAVRWRVHPRWYASVFIGTALAVVAAFRLSLVLGGPHLSAPPLSAWLSLPILLVFLAIFALGEEVGWRGFVLPRLQNRYGALAASLMIGVVHAAWHIPVWFIPNAGYDGQPFPVFILFTVALSIVFTWLYNSTGGSVWMVSLAHGAINAFPSVWGMALSTLPADARGLNPMVYLTLVYVPVALLLIVFTKPRTLTGPK